MKLGNWFNTEQSDSIKIGDKFDWQPYGTNGWPRATELGLIVTNITYPDSNSESGLDEIQTTADLCDDDDPEFILIWTLKRDGRTVANNLLHFRSMTARSTM